MEIEKWANEKGFTLVLSSEEAADLRDALKKAILMGTGGIKGLDIEVEDEYK